MVLLSHFATTFDQALLTKNVLVVLFIAECPLMKWNNLEKFVSQLKCLFDITYSY